MVRRIIEHNRLNGVVFSTIEFLLVAVAATFVGLALALQKEWVGVMLAAGTTLNCLVVVAFGVAAWRRESTAKPRLVVGTRAGAVVRGLAEACSLA